MASSPKHPAEIFGYPVESTTDEAAHVRERHWCPFLDEKCWKQSRNLDVPFGVCSVRYMDKVMATCPSRFLQQRRVFQDIAQLHFGDLNNLLLFREIGTRARTRNGRNVAYTFDYVIAKHAPLSTKIEDFVVVEFQTVDTTNTGKLVLDIK